MTEKIILKGYYGFGNLGDDILLLVSFNLAKDIFPNHEIIVCSNSDNCSYISGFLGEKVSIVKDNDNIFADWIILGGGGVFFDFKTAGFKYYFLNKFIRLIGFNAFRKLYKSYRQFKGNPGINSIKQAGWGIGVGSYSRSSQKFFSDIVMLSGMNFLLLRDPESERKIQKMKFTYPIYCSTDLAFLFEHWKKKEYSKKKSTNSVGFILRDWDYEDNLHFKIFEEAAARLILADCNVKFFSFDQFADKRYRKYFSNRYPLYVWDPASEHLDNYLEKLADCSLVVTSRAHGAIISACLDIPSICIAVEPKLEAVSNMLKHSSAVIKKPFRKTEIVNIVMKHLSRIELTDSVKYDVEENNSLIKGGIDTFKQLLLKI